MEKTKLLENAEQKIRECVESLDGESVMDLYENGDEIMLNMFYKDEINDLFEHEAPLDLIIKMFSKNRVCLEDPIWSLDAYGYFESFPTVVDYIKSTTGYNIEDLKEIVIDWFCSYLEDEAGAETLEDWGSRNYSIEYEDLYYSGVRCNLW